MRHTVYIRLGLCKARVRQRRQLTFSGPLFGAYLCWLLHTSLHCSIYGLCLAWILSCKILLDIIPPGRDLPYTQARATRKGVRDTAADSCAHTGQLPRLAGQPRSITLALQARLFCGAPPGEGQPPRRSPRPRVCFCHHLAPACPAAPHHPLRMLLWLLLRRRLHSLAGFLGCLTEPQVAVMHTGWSSPALLPPPRQQPVGVCRAA